MYVWCGVLQEVVGMSEEEPVFWEKGKLKLKFIHEHSKQALSVRCSRCNTVHTLYMSLCVHIHVYTCWVGNYFTLISFVFLASVLCT